MSSVLDVEMTLDQDPIWMDLLVAFLARFTTEEPSLIKVNLVQRQYSIVSLFYSTK